MYTRTLQPSLFIPQHLIWVQQRNIFTYQGSYHGRQYAPQSFNNFLISEMADSSGGISSSAESTVHKSVMLAETLEALDLHDGQAVVDATVGQGGHSEAMLEAANVRVTALDADVASVEATRTRLSRFGDRAQIIEANFQNIVSVVKEQPDRVLFDLGWNRNQLASGKGFSFQGNEPLNMSYGAEPLCGFTASEILNSWSEEAIANVLYGYGDERYARRIAKNAVAERAQAPIATTRQFVSIIDKSVPAAYRHGRTHFATKSFQALRIAVNDEMGSLEKGLRGAWAILVPNGRIVAITFHSLEDRLVKRLFAEFAKTDGRLANKKPITPTREEIISNPAARSAKLRAIIKS